MGRAGSGADDSTLSPVAAAPPPPSVSATPRRRDLFALILAESFGLAALGALIGAGGAWLLYSGMDVAKATHGVFVSFEVTGQMLGTAALVASLLGVLSCVAPAIAVARMSVTEGLRTLD